MRALQSTLLLKEWALSHILLRNKYVRWAFFDTWDKTFSDSPKDAIFQ